MGESFFAITVFARKLVVICNLYVLGAAIAPNETQAPLIVDTNAILTFAIPFQGFEPVSGWNAQIIKPACSVKDFQFTPSSPFNRSKAPDRNILK
jgi:hypothetical protein